MGKQFFCDVCRKSEPLEEQLQDIIIGKNLEAEACITCASAIRQNIKDVISAAAIQMAKAQEEIPTPAPSLQQPDQPADPKPPEPRQGPAEPAGPAQ